LTLSAILTPSNQAIMASDQTHYLPVLTWNKL